MSTPIFQQYSENQFRNFGSTAVLAEIVRKADSPCIALYLSTDNLQPGYRCLERMEQALLWSGANIVYADYTDIDAEGNATAHPLIDRQEGALRNDFDFGQLLMIRTDALRKTVEALPDYSFAALYAALLELCHGGKALHLRENLYRVVAHARSTAEEGERQFDYVDPRNRQVQIEMEQACTAYLKHIGAWLAPEFTEADYGHREDFEVEMSVIIPVRNRRATIADAVRSAADQQASFPYNIIVVDNHSDDGTSEILDALAAKIPSLVILRPERTDLGIGGCWDTAIRSPRCGRFALQLDSDDVYSSADTLETVHRQFMAENCAMVIGSYTLTDFNLNPIPPGLIDHSEWTAENGRNNALRINGLGAPRAFAVNELRKIGVPNVSYGEDYALGLGLSRRFRIGRIYRSLYNCRRWGGNSDSNLSLERRNANDLYKDLIRTIELKARLNHND